MCLQAVPIEGTLAGGRHALVGQLSPDECRPQQVVTGVVEGAGEGATSQSASTTDRVLMFRPGHLAFLISQLLGQPKLDFFK